MFKTFFNQAFRNLLNQKSHSLVIIICLSVTMAISFLLLNYVQYEKSFDNFPEQDENLYSVNVVGNETGKDAFKSPYSFALQGPVPVDEIPEIKHKITKQ